MTVGDIASGTIRLLLLLGDGDAHQIISGAAQQLSSAQQNDFTTLAILALTSGSLIMIFFVLCVEQLTHSSRELHTSYSAVKSAGARFYGCKYLFALMVLGISSSVLIGDGVIAFMRLVSITPNWLNMPIVTGTAILEFACWSFVLVVVIIGFLEFRLRPFISFMPPKEKEPQPGSEVRLNSRRFSRLRSDIRIIARSARLLTLIAFIVCIALRATGGMSELDFALFCPAFGAGVLVVNAMFYSGLVTLFFMQTAAFVIVTDKNVFIPTEPGTRLYLLSKQLEDPHRNMWIFPGGMMARAQVADPLGYIHKKLDLAGVRASIWKNPIYYYRHLMPEEGVAYRGIIYYAMQREGSLDRVPRNAGADNQFCALTFSEMTSDLVPELIRNFAAECEKRAEEGWSSGPG